jgi:hypothetical protein
MSKAVVVLGSSFGRQKKKMNLGPLVSPAFQVAPAAVYYWNLSPFDYISPFEAQVCSRRKSRYFSEFHSIILLSVSEKSSFVERASNLNVECSNTLSADAGGVLL